MARLLDMRRALEAHVEQWHTQSGLYAFVTDGDHALVRQDHAGVSFQGMGGHHHHADDYFQGLLANNDLRCILLGSSTVLDRLVALGAMIYDGDHGPVLNYQGKEMAVHRGPDILGEPPMPPGSILI